MKYILLLIFSLFYLDTFAQISEQDLKNIKSKIETESTTLKATLTKNSSDAFFVQFQIDTFKIERLLELKINHDYSTIGMIEATNEAEKEYDLLLNKYYKLLLNKLEPNDKVILQEAQRNWIKFRDSERALITLLSDEKYSGGGTIQGLIDADSYLGITRERVIEIKNHLTKN